jgi:hypothetical protein
MLAAPGEHTYGVSRLEEDMGRTWVLDTETKGTGANMVPLTPLPPGHVRKKTTGEIGKVRSVDSKAGTAEVFWLRRGDASTVPLSAISRR